MRRNCDDEGDLPAVKGQKNIDFGFWPRREGRLPLYSQGIASAGIDHCRPARNRHPGVERAIVIMGQKYQEDLHKYDLILKSPGIVLEDQKPGCD